MLKFIIITQDDPFYLPYFFKEFYRLTREREDLEMHGIVIQKPLGKKSFKSLVQNMYDFYGWQGFIRKGIQYVLYKILGFLATAVFKGRFPGVYSIRHLAMKVGWDVLPYTNVNSKAFIGLVNELQLDMLVSVGGSQKFKTEVLNAPKYGCLNIHNSKLPKLRGMLPTFWALLDYEKDPTSASTIFRMDEDWDAGPIVLQEEFALDPGESLEQLIVRSKKAGAQLMLDAILLHQDGEPEYRENNPEEATYRSFPKKADVELFKSKGYRLL